MLGVGFELVDSVQPADWIKERLVDRHKRPGHRTVNCVIPEGFEAYARIYHRVEHMLPDGSWEPLRWATVAEWYGTVVHPSMTFPEIARLQLGGPGRSGSAAAKRPVGSIPRANGRRVPVPDGSSRGVHGNAGEVLLRVMERIWIPRRPRPPAATWMAEGMAREEGRYAASRTRRAVPGIQRPPGQRDGLLRLRGREVLGNAPQYLVAGGPRLVRGLRHRHTRYHCGRQPCVHRRSPRQPGPGDPTHCSDGCGGLVRRPRLRPFDRFRACPARRCGGERLSHAGHPPRPRV